MRHACIRLSTQQQKATLDASAGQPVLSTVAEDLARKAELALEVPDRTHFRNLTEAVVEPAAPSSKFAALISCLYRSMSGYAWSTITPSWKRSTAARWNINGGSLDVNIAYFCGEYN